MKRGKQPTKQYNPGFAERWPNKKGIGRFVKRQLSKARRRYARQLLQSGRGNPPTKWESEANWKCW